MSISRWDNVFMHFSQNKLRVIIKLYSWKNIPPPPHLQQNLHWHNDQKTAKHTSGCECVSTWEQSKFARINLWLCITQNTGLTSLILFSIFTRNWLNIVIQTMLYSWCTLIVYRNVCYKCAWKNMFTAHKALFLLTRLYYSYVWKLSLFSNKMITKTVPCVPQW